MAHPDEKARKIGPNKLIAFFKELLSRDDIDSILRSIIVKMSDAFGVDRTSVFLYSPEDRTLHSKIAQNASCPISFSIDEGLAGVVARTKKPYLTPDAYKDSNFKSEFDLKSGYLTRSVLGVPMLNLKGDLIGVIQLINKLEGPFDEDDLATLESIAPLMALKIEATSYREHIEAQNKRLKLLLDIEKTLSREVREDSILRSVLQITMDSLDAEAASLVIAEEKDSLQFKISLGGGSDVIEARRISRATGIIGWVIENAKPALVDDAPKDPRFYNAFDDMTNNTTRTVAAVPVVSSGRVLGGLEIINKHGGGFTPMDMEALTLISGQMASILETLDIKREYNRSEKMALIGNMASQIIHDMKNPLTSIMGFSQIISSDSSLIQNVRNYSDIIFRECIRMEDMANELLAFAKGHNIEIVPGEVSVRQLVEAVFQTVPTKGRETDVKLTNDCPPEIIWRMDGQKMHRAIGNLARNAAEALMTLRGDGGEVVVTAEEIEGNLHISITDNGPGISEKITEDIFSPFVSCGKPKGTGLGLAITRNIVEKHGGSVNYRSKPGETVFTIILPAATSTKVN